MIQNLPLKSIDVHVTHLYILYHFIEYFGLFKGGEDVKSEMFDITLMTCLLRHFTDVSIYDGLPGETFTDTGEHISRIKYYRNMVVHSKDGKLDNQTFEQIWDCVSKVCETVNKIQKGTREHKQETIFIA